MRNVLGQDGVRVCRQMCLTCIFRPGNLKHLRSGRLAAMVKEVHEEDGFVVCHETLGGQEAICRGSFDRYKTTPIQLMERLAFIDEVEPDPAVCELRALTKED